MSDISIPGVTNKLNTSEMVKKLVEAESVPMDRMEKRVDTFKQEKNAWQELNLKLGKLKDSSKNLFGFQNPFNERVAHSSSPRVLTASASRQAPESISQIKVKQLAQADRFLSRSLDPDFNVPEGDYRFRVGKEEISFSFPGGSLESFANRLNDKAAGLIKAKVVNNSLESKVLLIESLKTGSENHLSFLDAAEQLGLEAGFFRHNPSTELSLDIRTDLLSPWTKPVDEELVSIENGVLNIGSGGEVRLPLNPPFPINENIVLEFDARVIHRPGEEWSAPSPPPGPDIPDTGSISLEGITIENEESKTILPEWEAPEPPQVIDDKNFLFLQNNGQISELPELQDTDEFKTYKIPLSEYVSDLNSLNIRNRNTYRDLSIKNIRIYDPRSRGDYTPLNPVSEAQDALLNLDGIEIRRSTNSIDDLIPGTTIDVHSASSETVNLEIEPDKEQIKNSVIEFVYHYNRLRTELNILTRNDESVIEEIQYLSDEERESASERLGMFSGDSSLRMLSSQLQNALMNSYSTRAEGDLTLMHQLGISTNAAGTSRTINTSRLRGYLEFDEAKFDRALEKNIEAVKDLFGNDTDGDLVVDSGVAHKVDAIISPYSRSGGFIATRVATINNQVERTNQEIEDYGEHLREYEARMREDFAQMEGALQNLEESSKRIENFSRSSGQ